MSGLIFNLVYRVDDACFIVDLLRQVDHKFEDVVLNLILYDQ